MKDKKTLTAIIVAILAIIVVVINLIPEKESDEKSKPIIVTSYSDFYTINSCLYRIVTYASAKDSESLLLVLNEKYKKENNITKNDVLNLFSDISENSTFVSEKMYYEDITDTISKYYVKGYVTNQLLFDDEVIDNIDKKTIYFVVYLDSLENIFSVEPYDGNIFEVGEQDEK